MEVVGEAGDGRIAVAAAVEQQPDVLLLDVTMPVMNGLEAARELAQKAPDVKILVMTMHQDEAYLRQFLQLGARGYILKKAADTELVSAIRAVQRGEVYIHSSMMVGVINRYVDRPGAASGPSIDLTQRETEVLTLVAHGYTSEQIADRLSISVNTVHTHRSHVMEKLGIRGRSGLMRYAIAHGLLKPEET